MDDDDIKRHPLPASKMSKTPSWVMLGFVLGAAFVLALPDWQKDESPPPQPVPARAAEPEPPAPPRTPPPLSRVEAVFEDWGRYAVWSDETTEIALWDPAEERFSDFYEVRRIEGVLYFRSIPRLTRRVIKPGRQLAGSPLLFTETEEQFRAWDERDRAQRPLERMWEPAAPAPAPVPAPPKAGGQKITPELAAPKPGTMDAGKEP